MERTVIGRREPAEAPSAGLACRLVIFDPIEDDEDEFVDLLAFEDEDEGEAEDADWA